VRIQRDVTRWRDAPDNERANQVTLSPKGSILEETSDGDIQRHMYGDMFEVLKV
jgi:hypothetical protein